MFASEFPPGPGGLGTHAFQVARQLRLLGWHVEVLTTQNYASEQEIAGFNSAQPFQVHRLPPGGNPFGKFLTRWRALARCIEEGRPDILLASGNRQVYLAALLAPRHGLPWVAVEHGNIPRWWERKVKLWSLARATRVVCVSQYTLSHWRARGASLRNADVILNGADREGFTTLPRHECEAAAVARGLDGERLVITVGSVTTRKGQDVVIRALPHILKRVPNVHYLCAGLPSKRDEFAAIARRLGVDRRVHFLGSVPADEMIRLLNASDLFVMTSRHADDVWEGFGIAVIEAALCGKPAVVSSSAGLAEAIVDGVTGLGVPEDDEVRTAEAILRLLEDEALRARMGEAARERARSEFTWECKGREYDALLRRLVEQSRPSAELPSQARS